MVQVQKGEPQKSTAIAVLFSCFLTYLGLVVTSALKTTIFTKVIMTALTCCGICDIILPRKAVDSMKKANISIKKIYDLDIVCDHSDLQNIVDLLRELL